MLSNMITPTTIAGAKTVLPAISLWTKVKDVFSSNEEVRIELVSPNYRNVKVLWGLFQYEQGERKTFIIRGKPGFCSQVVAHLQAKQGGTVNFLPPIQ